MADYKALYDPFLGYNNAKIPYAVFPTQTVVEAEYAYAQTLVTQLTTKQANTETRKLWA